MTIHVAVLSAQLVAFEITSKTMSWGGGLRIVGILCCSTVGAVERCLLMLVDSPLTHSAVQFKDTATGHSSLPIRIVLCSDYMLLSSVCMNINLGSSS